MLQSRKLQRNNCLSEGREATAERLRYIKIARGGVKEVDRCFRQIARWCSNVFCECEIDRCQDHLLRSSLHVYRIKSIISQRRILAYQHVFMQLIISLKSLSVSFSIFVKFTSVLSISPFTQLSIYIYSIKATYLRRTRYFNSKLRFRYQARLSSLLQALRAIKASRIMNQTSKIELQLVKFQALRF